MSNRYHDWREGLVDGADPVLRRHAEAMLARGPRPGHVAAAPDPTRVGVARRLQLVTCLYRQQGCGCEAPKCWWRGRPVTLKDCEACHP